MIANAGRPKPAKVAAPFVLEKHARIDAWRIQAVRFNMPSGEGAMRIIRSPYYLSGRNARVENPISSRELVLHVSPRALATWKDPVPRDLDDPQWQLREAVIRADMVAALALLERKAADPNRGLRSDAKYRVLNDAAYLGRTEIVRALLRHGARTRPTTKEGDLYLDPAGEALHGLGIMSSRPGPGGFISPGSEDFGPGAGANTEAEPHAQTVGLLADLGLFEPRHAPLTTVAGMGPFAAQRDLALDFMRRGHSTESRGASALEAAAQRGNEPMVGLLLEHRTFPREVLDRSLASLARLGRAQSSRALISAGADGTRLVRVDGLDAFRALSSSEDPATFHLLLDQGLDPRTTFQGRTLLMAAVPDAALMRRLIDAGVDVNARDARSGLTALHLAAAAPLPKAGLDGGLNAIADPERRREAVRVLLAAGADPNALAMRQTALMRAAPDAAIIDALIMAGGLVVQGDEVSERFRGIPIGPVAWAIVSDRETLALRVLEAQRELSTADCGSVHYASTMGMPGVLEALLARGQPPNRLDMWGDTPLRAAARAGQVEPMRVLLRDRRVAVDERSPMRMHAGLVLGHGVALGLPGFVGGATALHRAASGGHADAVKFLLEHGADARARTAEGKTAVDLAEDDKVRRLLERRAR